MELSVAESLLPGAPSALPWSSVVCRSVPDYAARAHACNVRQSAGLEECRGTAQLMCFQKSGYSVLAATWGLFR